MPESIFFNRRRPIYRGYETRKFAERIVISFPGHNLDSSLIEVRGEELKSYECTNFSTGPG